MAVPTSSPILRRAVVATGVALAAASLVVLLVTSPAGVATSRDAGAPTVPLPFIIGPSVVGIALALLIPPRDRRLPVRPDRRGRLLATTAVLVAIVILFPLVVGVAGIGGEDYVLLKMLLLVVVPLVAVRIERSWTAWRWWAPVAVVAVWALLRGLVTDMPDYSAVPSADLLIAATATAITAGFGEELLYRRLLQTRLEALLGGWPGIVLASLAFALMHLGSHGGGNPVVDIASVIVVQGGFGLLMGVLWWRFRNLPLIVAAHVLANGWPEIVLHVLTR